MQFLKTTDPRFHLVETRARWFIIVAVVGILGLIGFVIWKQELFRPSLRIHLSASSSQGVRRGMAVRLSGFRIGKISSVELEKENRVRVDMDVFSEYAHFLRRNSVANVASESLLGDRFIEMTAGTEQSGQLEEGDTLPLLPEKSMASLMENLKDEIRPAVADTRDIIAYLNNPKGDFKTTLANLSSLTDAMNRQVPPILKEAQLASEQGATLFRQLNKRDESLWRSIDGLKTFTSTLNSDFPPLIGILEGSLTKLDQAANQSNSLMTGANTVVKDLGDMVKKAAPELPKLLKSGEQTVKNADDVVSAVKRLWPVKRGVLKAEEKVLRPEQEE